MSSYSKNIQKGRSMIEMLGVLAIVGVLSAGGIAGYSMAMQSYKTTALMDNVQIMMQATRMVFKNQSDYAGVSTYNLIQAGKISVNDIRNPFGGNLNIGASGGMFFIDTQANIPAEACVDILMTNWGREGVLLGLNVVDVAEYRLHDGTYPISDVSTAVSSCKGGNKKMRWWFK